MKRAEATSEGPSSRSDPDGKTPDCRLGTSSGAERAQEWPWCTQEGADLNREADEEDGEADEPVVRAAVDVGTDDAIVVAVAEALVREAIAVGRVGTSRWSSATRWGATVAAGGVTSPAGEGRCLDDGAQSRLGGRRPGHGEASTGRGEASHALSERRSRLRQRPRCRGEHCLCRRHLYPSRKPQPGRPWPGGQRPRVSSEGADDAMAESAVAC